MREDAVLYILFLSLELLRSLGDDRSNSKKQLSTDR